MYTEEDASQRIHRAWFGSLDPRKVTLEYLEKLHVMISNWLMAIELAIKHAKTAEKSAKVADKEISP